MKVPSLIHSTSLGLVAAAAFLVGCAGESDTAGGEGEARVAVAHLSPTEGNEVSGTVTFIEDGDQIRVVADINGLSAGEHGFHVHENGDCSAPDATSAGGHFNPTNQPHAAHDADQRHVGDFGNITANQSGVARAEFTDSMIKFDGQSSIIGKAVIVHAGRDDLTSQPSGSSGARVACGVIEFQQ